MSPCSVPSGTEWTDSKRRLQCQADCVGAAILLQPSSRAPRLASLAPRVCHSPTQPRRLLPCSHSQSANSQLSLTPSVQTRSRVAASPLAWASRHDSIGAASAPERR